MDTKICTKCKKELPATKEYFYEEKRRKSGFCSRCKECFLAPYRKEKPQVKDGFKICRKCKRELPIEKFSADKRSKDNLTPRCRECISSCRKINSTLDGATKICTTCGIEYPATLEYFYKSEHSKLGLHPKCKKCVREYDNSEERQKAKRAWTARNREKVREFSREYKATPSAKAKTRLNHVLHNYQLTEEELVQMMNNQKGCCEVCGDSLVKPDSKRFYAVDHNHTTGAVRGLLCNECNLVLGYVKEDKDTLLKAIAYLEKYNE